MDVYAKRRQALKELLAQEPGGDQAVVLFFSGEELNLVPYDPDPDFYYFTGVESAGAALLITATPQKVDETLLLPAPDAAAERWTGKVLTAGTLTRPNAEPDVERKGVMKETGFGSVAAFHQLEQALVRPLRLARVLYLDFPEDAIAGPIGQTQLFWEHIRRRYPFLELRHLGRLSGKLRRNKDAHELKRMRVAAEITGEAHAAVTRALKPGMKEYELQALLEYVFRARGAQRLAFPSIVGSGPFSCILHYGRNDRTMRSGDLVVCDIGARKDQYCADVTRTYPVSGKFTKRQRQIYEVVLGALYAAQSAVKSGAMVHEVHKAAYDFIDHAGFAKYFFHGTSHYLGLEAHDVGSYSDPLEVGTVITIEPGIYIATEELGVRIEDDVVVTAKGCEVLTEAIPREAKAIEKLLAAPRRTLVI